MNAARSWFRPRASASSPEFSTNTGTRNTTTQSFTREMIVCVLRRMLSRTIRTLQKRQADQRAQCVCVLQRFAYIRCRSSTHTSSSPSPVRFPLLPTHTGGSHVEDGGQHIHGENNAQQLYPRRWRRCRQRRFSPLSLLSPFSCDVCMHSSYSFRGTSARTSTTSQPHRQ